MPFDSTTIDNPRVALYLRRREKACALWESIPDEVYDHETWGRECSGCGTTACALGWLAAKKLNGWRYNEIGDPAWRDAIWCDVFSEAAEHFGLPATMGFLLFNSSDTAEMYGKPAHLIKGKDVAAALREAPVVIYPE